MINSLLELGCSNCPLLTHIPQYFNGTVRCVMNKKEMIDTIYNDKKKLVEDYQDEIVNHKSFKKIQKTGLINWLNSDDDDKKVRETKNKLNYLLHNNRKMIQETHKLNR